MPNWCNNLINITGPREKIEALWKAATAEDSGLLQAMVPLPRGSSDETEKSCGDENQVEKADGLASWDDMRESLRETVGDCGDDENSHHHEVDEKRDDDDPPAVNWYEWRMGCWGTKWEVDIDGIEYTDNGDGTATVSGFFDSAWSPPTQAYSTFSELNQDCEVTASFYEQGCDFAGFWENGDEEVMTDLREESRLPEEEQTELFKRLDEEWDLSRQFDDWNSQDDTNSENSENSLGDE